MRAGGADVPSATGCRRQPEIHNKRTVGRPETHAAESLQAQLHHRVNNSNLWNKLADEASYECERRRSGNETGRFD